MLLPETTTFFQVAIDLSFLLYYNNKYACHLKINLILQRKNQSNPTKNDDDVKYIAPFGAGVTNSADDVAITNTPDCDT